MYIYIHKYIHAYIQGGVPTEPGTNARGGKGGETVGLGGSKSVVLRKGFKRPQTEPHKIRESPTARKVQALQQCVTQVNVSST